MNIPGRRYIKDEEILSDWIPRGGDGIVVRAQAIDWSNVNTKLTITLFHKNIEEVGSGTVIDAVNWKLDVPPDTDYPIAQLIKISAAGTSGVIGMKELVRYKLVASGGSAGDWVLARVFPPIFFDKSH